MIMVGLAYQFDTCRLVINARLSIRAREHCHDENVYCKKYRAETHRYKNNELVRKWIRDITIGALNSRNCNMVARFVDVHGHTPDNSEYLDKKIIHGSLHVKINFYRPLACVK